MMVALFSVHPGGQLLKSTTACLLPAQCSLPLFEVKDLIKWYYSTLLDIFFRFFAC